MGADYGFGGFSDPTIRLRFLEWAKKFVHYRRKVLELPEWDFDKKPKDQAWKSDPERTAAVRKRLAYLSERRKNSSRANGNLLLDDATRRSKKELGTEEADAGAASGCQQSGGDPSTGQPCKRKVARRARTLDGTAERQ